MYTRDINDGAPSRRIVQHRYQVAPLHTPLIAAFMMRTMAGSDAIAAREGCAPCQVTRILSLAHLAPDIVEAAIAGRLPNGIGFRVLVDEPADWARQRQ